MTIKINKTTKLYKAMLKCYNEVLDGTFLAIDPSTGSKSSVPGYALFEKGQLVESGEIITDIHANRSKRLYEISRTIREEFPKPDVLAVEYIPPVSYKGSANRMNSTSLMALQKAIGAILVAHPVDHLVEVPAITWGKYKPEDYVKTDEYDALSIGYCVIAHAKFIKEIKEKKK